MNTRLAMILCMSAAVILSIALIFPLIAGTGSAQSQQGTPSFKGGTICYGHTSKKDSGFKMGLASQYWYPKLFLYLGTFRNESSYEVMINGETEANGTLVRGDIKELNFTLAQGEQNIIRVYIDKNIFEYRKLVASESVEEGWNPAKEEYVVKFGPVEWTRKQLFFAAAAAIGGLIGRILSFPASKTFGIKDFGRLKP